MITQELVENLKEAAEQSSSSSSIVDYDYCVGLDDEFVEYDYVAELDNAFRLAFGANAFDYVVIDDGPVVTYDVWGWDPRVEGGKMSWRLYVHLT